MAQGTGRGASCKTRPRTVGLLSFVVDFTRRWLFPQMPLGVCDASSALLFSRDSDTPARTVSYRLRPRSRPEDCSSVLVGKSPRSFSRLLRRLSFLTSTLLTKDDLSVNFKVIQTAPVHLVSNEYIMCSRNRDNEIDSGACLFSGPR